MKRIGGLLLTLLAAVLFSGCVSCASTPPDYVLDREYQSRQELTGSLFEGDELVLSNEDIEKILASKVVLPPKSRLAVLRYGSRFRPFWWSEEFAEIDRRMMKNFYGKLRSAQRLSDVSVLPSMLAPKGMTVPYLREAAARLQANMLLVYRTESQTYPKYRLFGKDEIKAYCTVEAALLDVRTGIVSFTSIVTEDYSAEKSGDDMSFSETIAKAERQAVGKAMCMVADDLVKFVDAMP